MKNFLSSVTKGIGTPLSLIIHTAFFVGIFLLRFVGVAAHDILLILTTVVSLEAIYLSIFIQMTVNEQAKHIENVKEQMEDVQEQMDDVQESIEDVQESIDEEVSDIREMIE